MKCHEKRQEYRNVRVKKKGVKEKGVREKI